MTEDPARSSRTWLLLVTAAVLGVAGVARLLLDVSATLLGNSVSCGNALGWIGGKDNGASSTVRAVCTAPLHNASLEGGVAFVAAIVLALGWLVATRARWPLAVLGAFVAFIVAVFAAGPVAGFVAAAALLGAFGVWRAFTRHRHAG